jgi:hypothetical protein
MSIYINVCEHFSSMKMFLMCELSISATLSKKTTKHWTTATNLHLSVAPLSSDFHLLILLLYEGCFHRNGPLNTPPKAKIKNGRVQ